MPKTNNLQLIVLFCTGKLLHVFGQTVVNFLIGGISSVKAHVTDIPDAEIKSKINMVYTIWCKN